MCSPDDLLKNNRKWSEQKVAANPDYFKHLSELKNPKYLWIGCSDSRVPANEIIGLEPGMVFVHRNVANQVSHTDLNCLSAAQYAVDVLNVEHIVITGHYDCGGVRAALEGQHHGIVDNWIRSIRDTYMQHKTLLNSLDKHQRLNRLCELNVKRQVENICHTRIVQNTWEKGFSLSVHDGLIHDLDVTKTSVKDVAPIYRLRPGDAAEIWPVGS
ncbi:MAG: carbonic anhydrase [Zetaproteobacteria bacterium CG_4_9_14_3_um_filter_49_83]|nr:MAG: carbonic anhydrase [Zetaproteobacteria bacterium CG1_02_49_23]PIQ32289.1 MAG: carbonic anhydrase [Zetaproteobacteria bacterium CG17_big_fil_post_rev_8_21_14_2_50_50_13]PIV30072.1 MAG: carbonic anhydrase [Zetaproteobacteria bacterium CG02_land_8_20_14_3_00_50_9]PIY56975.1 MAG: carbonic anhydrase [Zetaproteobacteria bacterium CG_4_10_14_0_8_um_filter_49_80]PJA34642.1 MAG: carbonic anhydrase [Zetaproteobacteria bacterium CG_4_9_14_3_um_filter_49_83]